jgi:putative peptidoglycan lipid II flippase
MNDTRKTVAKAAAFLMITVIVSRILGFAREAVMYSIFGQNYTTDAYRAAFSIPDFVYMMLVGGALSSAFIPVFTSFISNRQEEEGWKSASIVFNYIILLLLVLIFIAYLYTEQLIKALVPGLPAQYGSLAVRLTHIMFLQTVFMALNGFAMGILNSYNRFAAPAIGAVIYNLAIIAVGAALVKPYGIAAFSYGVVIGAALNFVVQIPALKRVGVRYHFAWNINDPGFVQIVILMVPVLASLGVVQLNLFVTQNLASLLGSGAVGALNLAQKIMNLPVGIFATSVATAVFPTLTAFTVKGEMSKFLRSSSLGLRAVFLLCIPASLGLIALGEPMIKLLFEHGEFTADMAHVTYQALLYYCIGIFAYSAVQLQNRSFFALKDTFTPVIASILTIALNILLAVKMHGPLGVGGLALAYSLAGIFNFLFLLAVLRIKCGAIGGRKILISFCISTAASVIMFVAVRCSIQYMIAVIPLSHKLTELVSVGAGVGIGCLLYFLLVYWFKLEESQLVLAMIRKKE